MNQNPAAFTLPLENEVFLVLASCFEKDNEESRAECFQQLMTKHDSDSFEKEEDETKRASITIMPYDKFPSSKDIFAYNEYTPTENTKIALKAYYTTNKSSELDINSLIPFYGKIVFQGEQINFVTLKPKENTQPDYVLSSAVEDNL